MPKHSSLKVDRRIGARLKQTRMIADKSQTELGQHLGVSFQQVQKYENGTNRISAATLARIAEFLSVPVTQFFDDPAVPSAAAKASRESIAIMAEIDGIANRKTRSLVVRMVRSMVVAARQEAAA